MMSLYFLKKSKLGQMDQLSENYMMNIEDYIKYHPKI